MGVNDGAQDRKWRALPPATELRGLSGYAFPAVPNPEIVTTYLLVNQLLGNEWRPRGEVASQQLVQLRMLLRFVEQQCPFYADRMRSCGLNAASLKSLDDFRRMPLLTRKDLQDSADLIRPRSLPSGTRKTKELSTSGSTSSPVRVQSTSVTAALWFACCVRDFIWANVDPQATLVSLRHFSDSFTAARTPEGSKISTWGPPMSQIFATGSSFVMDVGMDPDTQLALLLRTDPEYVLSYPSNLDLLGTMLAERGARLSRLKQIHTIGEVLPDPVRRKIQDVFQARVWDLYSSVEVGYIASQCPSGHGYHVYDENVLVEVVDDDGRPCPSGESGRVVLTGLVHYGTPLIRYDVGDYAVALDEPCPCGRGLSRLSHIIGRQRGQLVRPDGGIMFSSRLSVAIRDAGAIRQFQVIQHERDRVEVIVVPMDGFGAGQEKRIAEAFQREFGCPVKVSVTRVQRIERTPGGKYLDFVCKAK
ncbi:MAG: phenylacetate--CoA ligase family protein [Planctomycetes bacterium]|nr:phenylacetate--CoA ligase family protein [Planctomycetota bacterium]